MDHSELGSDGLPTKCVYGLLDLDSVNRYLLLTHVEDFVTVRLGHNEAILHRNMLALLQGNRHTILLGHLLAFLAGNLVASLLRDLLTVTGLLGNNVTGFLGDRVALLLISVARAFFLLCD